jgi:hypothetical protein
MPIHRLTRRAGIGAVIFAAIAIAVPPPVAAQSDFLKRGRGILDNLTRRAGLKEALRIGTQTVVHQVGRADYFNGDPVIHIPLPGNMGRLCDALARIGYSDTLDDLELRLNPAAEHAAPEAEAIFRDAVAPIVDDSLAQVGAIQAIDAAMGRYREIPFVPNVKVNLSAYVLDRALSALFLNLAREEKLIREQPAKRTSELLRRVFGR